MIILVWNFYYIVTLFVRSHRSVDIQPAQGGDVMHQQLQMQNCYARRESIFARKHAIAFGHHAANADLESKSDTLLNEHRFLILVSYDYFSREIVGGTGCDALSPAA
jgi:hypothetical protein